MYKVNKLRSHTGKSDSGNDFVRGPITALAVSVRELLMTGGKVMQSHLTQTGKDGAIYMKYAEELSSQGFYRDKKQVVSKIKNMLPFL